MSNNLIVAVFDNSTIAEKACKDFKEYALKGQGFSILSGVIVEKSSDGKLTVLEEQTRTFWGTTIGAVTGALIGLLGGPVGSIFGFAIGASAGLTGHALRLLLDDELVNQISAKLTPGRAAVLLEADEPSPFFVDNVVSGYGGSVHRKDYPE